MFDQGNCVLLLLARGIDVDQKEGDVVSANESHYSGVIMFLHAGLDTCPSCGLIGLLAFIDCFVRDLS